MKIFILFSILAMVLSVSSNESEECCDEDICYLPLETGPCRARMSRWGFDPKKGCCVKFVYGGCKGNENNFKTEKDCEEACGECSDEEDVCTLPLVSGPCQQYIPRWGFDPKKGCCVLFIFGGCLGNKNNYKTKKECENSCVCNQPVEKGPCEMVIKRWAYDSKRNKCKKFNYGGCLGNGNNFKSKKDCANTCVKPVKLDCHAKPDKGPCHGHFDRYYYNPSENCCLKFTYGGCGGNSNNFGSEKECLDKCGEKPVEVDCHAEPDCGPCDGHYERYYYDPYENCCFKFIYGGCGGNTNNFKSEKDCLAKCRGKD